MTFNEFIKQFKHFPQLSLSDKILYAGYYLHTERKQERLQAAGINALFDQAHLARPSNTSSLMAWLANSSSKRLLRDKKGYRLSASIREAITGCIPKLVIAPKQAVIDLHALEMQVTDMHQKTFLQETTICFENRAFRAATVMAWNLAYHHACAYVLSKHLVAFNTQLAKAYPKKKAITKHSDFEDLKESEVIEVGKGAQIFSKATAGTLDGNLAIRNSAAHPSSTVISPIKAEAVIDDLVKNIILRATL